MSRIAPEQLTFDFEDHELSHSVQSEDVCGAQILHFSAERLQARRQLAERERERQLLQDAARKVRFF